MLHMQHKAWKVSPSSNAHRNRELAPHGQQAHLQRAFLSAGAENVVVTLWRIDDAGAAAFAGEFYRAFRRHTLAEAIASTQRSISADSHYASPYYWAGYILSGTGTEPQETLSSSVSISSATKERLP